MSVSWCVGNKTIATANLFRCSMRRLATIVVYFPPSRNNSSHKRKQNATEKHKNDKREIEALTPPGKEVVIASYFALLGKCRSW
uniref:Uncharacterized protein n=1 Tax=Caenorhabditis japonica TaxID=281687 RepID=A0A8R1ECU1_CAEJA